MSAGTATEPTPKLDTDRLDGFVDRAQAAARAFRRLDQEAVDRIVWAMVVAGLRAAVELAELAIEETGFGVFEDKVVKNYIATEFLYDYLKDKRVRRRDRGGPERGIAVRRRADRRRARAAADHQPDLDRAVQGDRRGQDAQRDHLPPVGARRALRRTGRRDPPARRASARGCRPTRSRSIPDPTLDVSQYLFHHPGVDFIWTTGGPKAVAAANAAGKPCDQRRPRQRAGLRAPQRRRRRWPSSTS